MNLLALTGLINFITTAFLGAVVLIRYPKNPENRSFFYLHYSAALFSIGYFFWQSSANPVIALTWFKIL
jgi:hypothetical protein